MRTGQEDHGSADVVEGAHSDALPEICGAEQLAEYLGVPIKSVYEWNSKGTGPRRLSVGKHVRYRRQDVEAWLDGRYIANGTAA